MNARKLLALPLAFSGGILLATFTACTGTNENHCASKGGDAYCQEKTGLAAGAVFCTNNCGGVYDDDGCLIAEQPPAEGCWLCDGAGSENCDGMAEESSSESASETESSGSETATETSETSSTTEGPECMDSSMCDGQTPLCEDGACVGCGEGATTSCASEYPDTPACDAGTGTCVECTSEDAAACGGMTPVCEGFVCVGCDEHAQCPASACNMSTGACFDDGKVWWVDQTVASSGDGSQDSPLKTLAEAMAVIDMDAANEGVINLKTPIDHQEQLVIPAGATVAIIGKSDVGGLRGNNTSTVSVEGQLFIHDILINGGTTGISCAQGSYLVTDSTISTTGRGINTDGCMGTIRRSQVVGNTLGGIRVIAGEVTIENSMIGGDVNDQVALDVLGGTVNVSYSTLVAGFSTAKALNCAGGGAGSTIRNSLIVARTDSSEIVGCDQAEITNNAIEAALAGNTSLGAMNIAWFPGAAMADFHIGMNVPAPLTTAATWQTGDPATDIDGDARPTVDGTPDYAGADVPN